MCKQAVDRRVLFGSKDFLRGLPVIMSRLPTEVRLHVARVSTKDVWEINELLKVIQAEVEAREMSDTIKIQEKKGLKQLLHPREDFPQELLSHYLQG